MLDLTVGITHLNVREGVSATLVTNQHGIALGKVARVLRVFHDLHPPPIGILTALGRNALRYDRAARVVADVDHFRACISLLHF